MSSFEYVSVLASIIIGLGLADVLMSLNRLVRAGKTVRWDWAAPAASLLVVMTIIQIWWSLYRPVAKPITIGEFLPDFLEMVILFLLASAALPDDIPAEGLDLKAYYDRNGPYFWSLFTAALAWPTSQNLYTAVMTGETFPGLLIDRVGDLIVLTVFASLIFVRWRWWHLIALLALGAGPIGWLSRSLG